MSWRYSTMSWNIPLRWLLYSYVRCLIISCDKANQNLWGTNILKRYFVISKGMQKLLPLIPGKVGHGCCILIDFLFLGYICQYINPLELHRGNHDILHQVPSTDLQFKSTQSFQQLVRKFEHTTTPLS
jgi:hypothetical protein